MSVEDSNELALSIVLLELIRWTVADGRITEHGPSSRLDIGIELGHVLAEVEPEARLLSLAILQLREVDAEVEFV